MIRALTLRMPDSEWRAAMLEVPPTKYEELIPLLQNYDYQVNTHTTMNLFPFKKTTNYISVNADKTHEEKIKDIVGKKFFVNPTQNAPEIVIIKK